MEILAELEKEEIEARHTFRYAFGSRVHGKYQILRRQ